jgi:hypothetical protein
MKKVLYFFIMLAGLYSCSKDENSGLQDEVDSLKGRLEAIEKGKTVINVEFKDANMIFTYSSGEKVTLPLPKGLDGINGTNGTNGIGIKEITYTETTGILKITLTNGNVSEFKIVTNGNSLTAVLLSDVNGSYLLSNASMGCLNLADITYTDNNQVASITNNTIADRQQVKSSEITNQYTNGKLVNVIQKHFVTSSREYWDNIVNPNNGIMTEKRYAQKPNSEYICTANSDGTFSIEVYYGVSYSSSTNIPEYKYYTNPRTYKYIMVTNNELNSKMSIYITNYSTGILKLSDKKIVQLESGYVYSSTKRTDGKWDNIVYCTRYNERNLISNTKLGDVITNNNYAIESNDKGLMSTITLYRNSSVIPEYQLRLTYNVASKVVKSEKFVQTNGSWTSTGTFLAYEYNTTNQVTTINRFTPDGKSEKVAETIYDKNGNPIEIYALQDAVYSNSWDEWFNPVTNSFEYKSHLIKPAGFRLIATFEYDYQLKNFFGNSITAINPILDHYKVVNAIKRAWSAEEYGLNGWINYQDYNEFGYPQSMILNGNGESGRLEIRLTYQKKK